MECYDRLLGDVLQEERKLQHVKQQLTQTDDEPRDIECQVKATSMNIEQERSKAVQEIIELGATKQLVQSRLLSMAEAQR